MENSFSRKFRKKFFLRTFRGNGEILWLIPYIWMLVTAVMTTDPLLPHLQFVPCAEANHRHLPPLCSPQRPTLQDNGLVASARQTAAGANGTGQVVATSALPTRIIDIFHPCVAHSDPIVLQNFPNSKRKPESIVFFLAVPVRRSLVLKI